MTTTPHPSNTRNHAALTQIEFMVVAIVLALVVIVLMPALRGGHSKHEYQRVHDLARLRQIGVAMMTYVADHGDWLPEHPRYAMKHVGHGLSEAKDVWLNPYQDHNTAIDRGDFDGPATRFGGYVFLNLGVMFDEIEDASEYLIAYTAKVTPDQSTRNVLFVDGHTETWEEEKLRTTLPEGIDLDALDGP